MTKLALGIYGTHIRDRFTHYEYHTTLEKRPLTIVISGNIAQEFYEKYHMPITQYEKFQATIEYAENSELIDPFKSRTHLIGRIHSLEDIAVPLDEEYEATP